MSTHPPLRPTSSGRRPADARRAGERRVLFAGLAVSVVIHVVAIGLAGLWLDPEVRVVDRPRAERPADPERGLRAVEVAVRPDAEGPSEAVPSPDAPRAAPTRERALPEEEEREAESPAVAAADGPTATERLAPRVVDPGLWRPIVVLPRDPTIDDVRDRVAAAVEMLSDSALASAERAMRATDWTVTDGSGGRWGISPGQLHLGSVTIPLPLYFPTAPDHTTRASYWLELESQLERAILLESFEERVRAIRERRDRERDRGRAAGNGGG